MTSLPAAPAQLADIESQIARLLVQRDDLLQEPQLPSRRQKTSHFIADDMPTIAESEARIRRDVAKIRARSGSAKVAREEADRIEKLRQDKKKRGGW